MKRPGHYTHTHRLCRGFQDTYLPDLAPPRGGRDLDWEVSRLQSCPFRVENKQQKGNLTRQPGAWMVLTSSSLYSRRRRPITPRPGRLQVWPPLSVAFTALLALVISRQCKRIYLHMASVQATNLTFQTLFGLGSLKGSVATL